MPQSVPSAIDLQILAEYDRRCWTATAKQNKYVRLYALLQQATRKTKQTTEASRIKQAQYRNLMARSDILQHMLRIGVRCSFRC